MKQVAMKPQYHSLEMFANFEWLAELSELIIRYESLGMVPDIMSLTLVDAWGLYQWLKRLDL